jgi:sulfoxide reductase heme-binding subunit YedZ
MTEARLIRWVLKPIAWLACLGPTVWLVAGIRRGDLGADPVKTLTHTTGLSALVILLVTLTVTPVRRLTGLNGIIRIRRPLGLFAYYYATIHFLIYAVFDHRLSVPEIVADIAEHPWVLVGFSAFLILTALAVTSPRAAVRRLGGKRWRRLHLLIYPAAILAVLHFFWLVKKDTTEPLRYAAILGVLLIARLVPWARERVRAGRPARNLIESS